MEWVEVTGKTLDEAKDAALDQLGVDEADAEFEVVEEPRAGLFGRLRTEARVRARVRPTKPRAKDERRRRGGKSRGEAAGATVVPKAPARKRAARPVIEDGEEFMSEDTADVSLEEQAGVAREFLLGVLDRFDSDGDVSVRMIDEDTVEVVVEGDELGLLIGPKGATLSALQDLARTVVQRKTGARTGRLLLEVSGYRQRRKEALALFTTKVAAEVVESGTRRALEPMSAADRKVIHDTANEIDGVRTVSEGEDPRRRVVIEPA